MPALVRLAIVAIALVILSGAAFAADAPATVSSATGAPDGFSAVSLDAMPLVLAQSGDSSSGGSYRIPRGLIRLAIIGVIALFSAGAWVVRQMSGS